MSARAYALALRPHIAHYYMHCADFNDPKYYRDIIKLMHSRQGIIKMHVIRMRIELM